MTTFRRESLAATLDSLARQTLRPDRVIVADNDEAPSARPLCEAAARDGLPVTYVHAPARNICIARNACLDAAPTGRLAFIDDDEIAPEAWLERMNAALTSDLAGVSGPSLAQYPDDAPGWMRMLSPHSQRPPRIHGKLLTGHTANCLLDLDHPALEDLRFDERFGRTGGEDADYFARACARGAVFGETDAPVFEPVPPERLSEAWLAARRRRAGQTWYESLGPERRRKALAAAPKAVWCRARAALAPSEPARRRVWLRGLFHEGVLMAAGGVRPQNHYGGAGDGSSPDPASQTVTDRSR